jgi:hypothetical protein
VPESEVGQELDSDSRRELLTVLTAEHSNLQSARSTGVAEANSRTTSFFAALSGALVALALVFQVEALRDALLPIAFVFTLTVTYIGLLTFLRLVQLTMMDSLLVIGIARVRHRYIELVPSVDDLAAVTAQDDPAGLSGEAGLTGRRGSRLDMLASAPGMVAGIDGILAGLVAALGSALLGAPNFASVAIGVAVAVATDVALVAYGLRQRVRFWRNHPPRHPTPG